MILTTLALFWSLWAFLIIARGLQKKAAQREEAEMVEKLMGNVDLEMLYLKGRWGSHHVRMTWRPMEWVKFRTRVVPIFKLVVDLGLTTRRSMEWSKSRIFRIGGDG